MSDYEQASYFKRYVFWILLVRFQHQPVHQSGFSWSSSDPPGSCQVVNYTWPRACHKMVCNNIHTLLHGLFFGRFFTLRTKYASKCCHLFALCCVTCWMVNCFFSLS